MRIIITSFVTSYNKTVAVCHRSNTISNACAKANVIFAEHIK